MAVSVSFLGVIFEHWPTSTQHIYIYIQPTDYKWRKLADTKVHRTKNDEQVNVFNMFLILVMEPFGILQHPFIIFFSSSLAFIFEWSETLFKLPFSMDVCDYVCVYIHLFICFGCHITKISNPWAVNDKWLQVSRQHFMQRK